MRQSADGRPLPKITDLTRPFWSAAHEGKPVMQKCPNCGTIDFFPKPWCIKCGKRERDWVEVSPRGTVYSYTVASMVMMNLPGWKEDLPVVLGLIDLDDGGRMYAQIIGCSPDKGRIGMRVEAHSEQISDEAGIPKFRPV